VIKPRRKMPQRELLAEARALLFDAQRFHIQSVTIGKLEHLEESGIISHEISEARKFIERADLFCANLDRLYPTSYAGEMLRNERT